MIIKKIEAEQEEGAQKVWTFDQYKDRVKKDPYWYMRVAHQYILDAINSYGFEEIKVLGETIKDLKIWGDPMRQGLEPVYGHKAFLNNTFISTLSAPIVGGEPRIIISNGPVATAKSRHVKLVIEAVKAYSKTLEGAVYKPYWVLEKDSKKIKVPCLFNDNPLYLLTQEEFFSFIDDLKKEHKKFKPTAKFLSGGLCFNCENIFNTLLLRYANPEDVRKNIRIERYYLYESSGISVVGSGDLEAKNLISAKEDFHAAFDILKEYNPNIKLNPTIDPLANANRGIITVLEAFKEEEKSKKELISKLANIIGDGEANVGGSQNKLDAVIILTTNPEHYKKITEKDKNGDCQFTDLIDRSNQLRVRYLARASDEMQIYNEIFKFDTRETCSEMGGHKTPNTTYLFSLWVISTRLCQSRVKVKVKDEKDISIEDLPAIAKALFLDERVDLAERLYGGSYEAYNNNELKRKVRAEPDMEHGDINEECWSHGASSRVGLDLYVGALTSVIQSGNCFDLFAIRGYLKDKFASGEIARKYNFFEKDYSTGDQYRDYLKSLDDVFGGEENGVSLLELFILDDVKNSISTISYEDAINHFIKYIKHITADDNHDKIWNDSTKTFEEPSEDLMRDVEEKLVDSGKSKKTDWRKEWRKEILLKRGNYVYSRKDDPKFIFGPSDYKILFRDYIREYKNKADDETLEDKINERFIYEIERYGTDSFNRLEKNRRDEVERVIQNMFKLGNEEEYYCQKCAKTALIYGLKILLEQKEGRAEEKKT